MFDTPLPDCTLGPPLFNLASHLLYQRVAQGDGDRVAVIEAHGSGGQTLTYSDLWRLTLQGAAVLIEHGLRPGDRVVLATCDGCDFVVALFAGLAAGAAVVMTNPESSADSVAHLVNYVGARMLIAQQPLASQVYLPETCNVLAAGNAGTWRDLVAQASPLAGVVPTKPEDDAFWLLTSGSTGASKAAIHSHRNFAAHIECYAKPILKLAPDDVTLAVPKLHFPYATGMNLLFPLAVGARAILFPARATAEAAVALMAEHGATVFSTVPTMTAKLLALPLAQQAPLARLRLAVTAGEALPPHQLAQWQKQYAVPLLDGIGSAEMFHVYVTNRIDDVRAGSLGRVVPGYQTRVMLENETEAPIGEAGTLWVRGPSAAKLYHNDTKTTEATFRTDGWVVTGDVFRKDQDGYHQFEGRRDDLLKVAGLYVSPLEVEAVLRAHPAVEDCAVVGQLDDAGLTKPKAFVVLAPTAVADPALWEALASFCRERMLGYKVPRWWQELPALPRNDRGKLVRRALRPEGPAST